MPEHFSQEMNEKPLKGFETGVLIIHLKKKKKNCGQSRGCRWEFLLCYKPQIAQVVEL